MPALRAYLVVMIKAACLALALWAVVPGAASAQVPSDVVRAEIEHGWRTEDGEHVAGIRLRLAPGWKTYWRAPGEGGIPPSFNWSGSENIADVDVHFPVPEVFDQNGMRSIGYHDEVVFPLMIRPDDPAATIALRGEIDLGVCEEVCVPVTVRISGALSPRAVSSEALSRAVESRPDVGGEIICEITPIADGLRVVVEADLPEAAGEEVAVIEASENGLWISQPVLSRDGDRLRAEVEMVPPDGKPFALARSDVRLTVLADGGAVEMLGCD